MAESSRHRRCDTCSPAHQLTRRYKPYVQEYGSRSDLASIAQPSGASALSSSRITSPQPAVCGLGSACGSRSTAARTGFSEERDPHAHWRAISYSGRETDLVFGTFVPRGTSRRLFRAAGADAPDDDRSSEAAAVARHLSVEELGRQAAWGNVATPNPPSAVFTYTVGREPREAKLC